MPPEPTHYDVLGIGASASVAEIRRAYLRAARMVHPDIHRGSDSSTRAGAEETMRRVNQAWAVLGDPDRRRAYDGERVRTEAQEILAERRRRPPGSANPQFRPYVDDDVDYAAILDDAWDDPSDDSGPGHGARVPRGVQLAPPVIFMSAVATLAAGLVSGFGPLVVLGISILVLSGLSFALAPVWALARSLASERD